MKKCIDCGCEVKNRSKSTKRCWNCRVLFLKNNSNGRNLPKCKKCGEKLSAVKNKTGLCKSCSFVEYTPWNKNLKCNINSSSDSLLFPISAGKLL